MAQEDPRNQFSRSPTRYSLEARTLNSQGISSEEGVLSNSSHDKAHMRFASSRVNTVHFGRKLTVANQNSAASHHSSNEQNFVAVREKFILMMESNRIMSLDASKVVSQIPPTTIDEILDLSLDAKKESSENAEKNPKYFVECLKEALHFMEAKNGKSNGQNKAAQIFEAVIGRTISKNIRSNQNIKEVLSELQVCCTRQSVSWVSEFVEIQGLTLLFQLLAELHEKTDRKEKHNEIEVDILRIIRAVISQEKGIYDIFYNNKPLSEIVACLESPHIASRTFSSELLLILTTLDYPTGHQLVMMAFNDVAMKKDEIRPFRILVNSVKEIVQGRGLWGTSIGSSRRFTLRDGRNHEASLKETKEFLTSSISLIRYLIEIPVDIVYRMHLRQEFTACKLNLVFETIKSWPPDEFPRVFAQMKDIEELSQIDLDEFVESMDFLMNVDLNNPNDLLNALVQSFKAAEVVDTEGMEYITSILKHLLIPAQVSDGRLRYSLKYFAFIDNLLAQIGMDQKGITPDFTDTYNVPVEVIVRGLRDLDDYEQLSKELSQLRLKLYDTEHPIPIKDDTLTPSGFEVLKKKLLQLESNYTLSIGEQENELRKILSAISEADWKPSKHDSAFHSSVDLNQKASQPTASSRSEKTDITPIITLKDSNITDNLSSVVPISVPPPPPPGAPPPPPPLAGPPAFIAPRGILLVTKVLSRHQEFKPAIPTRRVQWEKIPDTILEKTIWSSKLKLQTKPSEENMEHLLEKEGILAELEQAFAVKKINKIEKNEVFVTGPEKIEILNSKVAQNLMITLRKATKNYSFVDLKEELVKFNEKIWSEEMIKCVIDSIPSKDEIEKILAKKSEIKMMRDAEAFFCVLLELPNLTDILQCTRYKLEFQYKYVQIAEELNILISAFEDLKKAELFPKVLELILNIGNYLNSGSFNANVHGFRLSSIRKLVDTKMSNGSGNLLGFVANLMIDKFPTYRGFLDELRSFGSASKISLPTILSNLSDISSNLVDVKSRFNKLKDEPILIEFNQKMGEFIENASDKIAEAKKKQQDLNQMYNEIVVYFGDPDPSKLQIGDYMVIIRDFVSLFEKALHDAQKEKEKKILKEKRIQKQTQYFEMHKTSAAEPARDNRTSVVESLLESLKDGRSTAVNRALASANMKRNRLEMGDNVEKPSIGFRKVSESLEIMLSHTQELLKSLE